MSNSSSYTLQIIHFECRNFNKTYSLSINSSLLCSGYHYDYENVFCECAQDGIITKFGIGDRMWCCKRTEDQCVTKGDNILCNGTAISLSDQCHDEKYYGPSCNYYPLDDTRKVEEIDRSYLDLCKDWYSP